MTKLTKVTPCLLCLLLFVLKIVNSANILGFVAVGSISHQIFFRPIWKELSLRGHNVTVFTTNPVNDSTLVNLTEIDISKFYDYISKGQIKDVIYNSYSSPFSNYYSTYENLVMPLIKPVMEHHEVQKLFRDSLGIKFDVALVEVFPIVTLALGYKLNCPVIHMISFNPYVPILEAFGNPIHPVFYPANPVPLEDNPGFLTRFYNVYQTIKIAMYHKYSVLKRCDRHLKEYFGEDAPLMDDVIRNGSALFAGINPVFDSVRPLIPTTVPLGFMHIEPPKNLPKDLQDFLDSAENGAIYASLGSNVKSSFLRGEVVKIFKEIFNDLPYKILWKWENDTLSDIKENVLLNDWFPQQDILRHPNIKLFITQGGLQSLEEAIYNKVPMVVLPFFSDQMSNANRINSLGIGKKLEPFSLKKDEFKRAILEVIQNPKYRDEIEKISKLSFDQKESSVERAVWWTEYVIRNKGTGHLKGPHVDAPIYQYFMLDIILFFVLILNVIFYLITYLNFYKKIFAISFLILFISYSICVIF